MCLQLFDVDNHVNREAIRYVFSTEGHLFPVSSVHRDTAFDSYFTGTTGSKQSDKHIRRETGRAPADGSDPVVVSAVRHSNISSNVSSAFNRYSLMIPLLLLIIIIILPAIKRSVLGFSLRESA